MMVFLGKNVVLLLFGVWLAYRTRNVSMAEANDSAYIGGIIYATFLVNVLILVVLSVVDTKQVSARFALTAGTHEC